MAIRLHNTLTRRKEEFVPLSGNRVGIYVCGPTSYNYFHIGNSRAFVTFDVLRRFLRYKGYQVKYVQNFTDIDDKVIDRARELGVDYRELSERYIKAYFEDSGALGVLPADVHPRATGHIADMIRLISVLFEKGYAYEIDGDVFYDTSRFPSYGKLSGQNLQELNAGARIEPDARKRNPTDFALWKRQKPGEPAWDSPWGKGRPGWHIECSAMAMKHLGETVDIHAGGADLIFPHHENEIAQSEAATGKTFVRYWLHNAYLSIEGEKMSKSLGNIILPRELIKSVSPEAIRYFLISAHYRSPLNFGIDQIAAAQSALERLYATVRNVKHTAGFLHETGKTERDRQFSEVLQETRHRFDEAMEDDLNTADAIASLFELTKRVNLYVSPDMSREMAEEILSTYRELGGVLGLLSEMDEVRLSDEVRKLIEKRAEARRRKDWKTADLLRQRIAEMGYLLEDTPHGVRVKKR